MRTMNNIISRGPIVRVYCVLHVPLEEVKECKKTFAKC